MLTSVALAAVRRAAPMVARAPVVQATVARCGARFMSGAPYAVDAPDGDHDLQDVEESSAWAKRAVDVASATEDAASIDAVHDAVFGKKLFAVDAPDGEHDLEDVEEHARGVERIVDEAGLFEDPDEVREQQKLRRGCLEEANATLKHDV